MEAFATKEQYDARYPGRTASDEVLTECLMDATLAIMAALDNAHVDYSDPSEDFAERLMRVCRSMANRLVPSGGTDVPVGVTQMGMTAGPYQRSFTFAQSYGIPKMLPSELSMLGIGASRIGWAPLGGDA